MKKVFYVLSFLMLLELPAQVVFREGYIIKVDKPKTVSLVTRNGRNLIMKPTLNKKFVSVNFALQSGRSLGKYDYVLKQGDKVFKCKWIGLSNESFNELNWEFRTVSRLSLRWSGEPKPSHVGARVVSEGSGVRLLFEVDDEMKEAMLIYNMAPTGINNAEISDSATIRL